MPDNVGKKFLEEHLSVKTDVAEVSTRRGTKSLGKKGRHPKVNF